MNYSFIIDDFTWSFSRLQTYEQCPYQFYLAYLLGVPYKNNFFTEYGLLMHDLHEKYFKNEITKDELPMEYVRLFNFYVSATPFKSKLRYSYYADGLDYWNDFNYETGKIVATESTCYFKVGNYRFIGRIDLVEEDSDGHTIITDHKSAKLEPRKRKKNPLKIGKLDTYLRQLYLYSQSFYDENLKYPDFLQFNCFRTNTKVLEPFDIERFNEAKEWALNIIESARADEVWEHHCDQFFCKNLCGYKEYCKYAPR